MHRLLQQPCSMVAALHLPASVRGVVLERPSNRAHAPTTLNSTACSSMLQSAEPRLPSRGVFSRLEPIPPAGRGLCGWSRWLFQLRTRRRERDNGDIL
jgi:hypothetical protein